MTDQLAFLGMGGLPPTVLGTLPPETALPDPRTAKLGDGRGHRRHRRGRPMRSTPAALKAYLYRKDVVFQISGTKPTTARKGGGERGVIKKFSAASQRRLRFLIRNTADVWEGFLTLTYPSQFPTDGRSVKKHLNAFCTWLRRNHVAYVWVLEFTERGTPHFHFCVSGWVPRDRWLLRRAPCEKCAKRCEEPGSWVVKGVPCKACFHGVRDLSELVGLTDEAARAARAELVEAGLESTWFGIANAGHPDHLWAGTQIDKIKNPDKVGAYIGSYISKLDDKEVPDHFSSVGRFWGSSRILGKTLVGFKTLYVDAARELRKWRGAVAGGRWEISQSQARLADVRLEQALNEPDPAKAKKLFRVHRGCEWRSISYARRWRWFGHGFTLLNGADFFRSILRQAVMLDRGGSSGSWNPCPCHVCGDGGRSERRLSSLLPVRTSCGCDNCFGRLRLASRLADPAAPWAAMEDVKPAPRPKRRKASFLPGPDATRAEKILAERPIRFYCPCFHCRRGVPLAYIPPCERGQILFDGKLAPEHRPEDFESGLTEKNGTPGVWG